MSYLGTRTGGRGVFISSDFNSVSFIGDGGSRVYPLPETIIQDDASVLVHIDGVKQHTSAYSVSGTSLTFTDAPPNTSNIEIIIFGVKSADTVITYNPNSISIMELDTLDGDPGQVLTTDGAGNLSFSSKSTETLFSMGVTVSATELNYVGGITSNINTQLLSKQDTLVSATNIKSINGDSILGSGDLAITGWSYATTLKFA
jgi:hypothetical protein